MSPEPEGGPCEHLWREMSPQYELPPEIVESFKATFRRPGVLTAALSYYRHTFNPANRDPALAPLQKRIATLPTAVPALCFFAPPTDPVASRRSSAWTRSSGTASRRSSYPEPATSSTSNAQRT